MSEPPAWALAMLREARVGRLATADAAGRPLLVPVCFAFDGAALYSAVDDKRKRTRDLRRLRNVRDNPQASLLVDVWDEDWTRLAWVSVEGHADVLNAGADFTRALTLLRAKYPQYRAMDLERDGAMLRLQADRILAWRAADPPA
ncbi:MAG TPA: TIGR03668 family PPOX class F420-dependent oxidoreductase [Patescibacteria group bacterium]|nr:TIGR03668 family PPOX class F420-dependent oxidoreductase [Patescibacteria group bacterium]